MTANVIVTVEREFDIPRPQVFRAWTVPSELAQWRGSPGWHVESDSLFGEAKAGGRHHHVTVRESDNLKVTTDGVYTEFFEPDVFVSRERITGDPGIDPGAPLELRVEFTKMGRNDTLVRIIQGPYEPDVAGWHGEAWEKELSSAGGLSRPHRRTGDHPMSSRAKDLSNMQHMAVVRTKPLMTMPAILIMNLGFFGIQYSFGLQQTAINPVYEFLGANPSDLPILNLAGPITGLLLQPLIGALSDRTWSPRYGRRKPFFLIGAIGCSLCLFLFPFVTAVWMAVILLWLLDASNNTAMEPYRAFIADKLPPSQLGKGFLAQSFFTGLGITLANISLFVFQKFISGATESGIPYWVVGSFMLGAVCSIGTVLVSVLRTKEIPPSPEELAALRAKKGGLGPAVKEIGEAIRDMPPQFRKLALVYFFQWYGMVCYWQFIALSIAKSAFPDTPEGKEEAVAWTGLVNGWYNIVTFSVAFSLVAFAKKRGARTVHCVCLLLAAVG